MDLDDVVRQLVQLYVKNLRVFTKLVKERDSFYVLKMNLPLLIWVTEDGRLIEFAVVSCSASSVSIGIYINNECDDTLLRIVIDNSLPLSVWETLSGMRKPKCVYILTNIKEKIKNIIENEISKEQVKCEDAGEYMLKCCVVADRHES